MELNLKARLTLTNYNMFKEYRKIHRLGKEETEGILVGKCYIQEKIDGANTSIWLDGETLRKGSRTQEVTDKGFNGFPQYVDEHAGIKKFFEDNGEKYRLYGEWLVRHTVAYNELAYKKFYLFDIWSNEDEDYLKPERVYDVAEYYGIEVVPLREVIENPTMEQLNKWIGITDFGDRGEGIVIKNFGFVDKFGVRNYAKVVTESFKEDNGVIFGGNNKHSETYNEVYVMNKYITLARVQKIMNKLQPIIEEKLDMKHIPRIMGTVYHDMVTEDMWEIMSDVPTLNFKKLRDLCNKKSKQIYVEIITGDVSVAHLDNNE